MESQPSTYAWLDRGEVPSLSGLRAVAVGLVFVNHFVNSDLLPVFAYWGTLSGRIGVDLFFVISGFIITTLLLRERERTGVISLRGFYLRRALRILPAYYAYLLVIAVLWPDQVTRRDWVGVLTYTQNFTPDLGSWLVSHFWSLSLEEHFYVVWPAAMLLLGPRRAAWLAMGLVAAAPLARVAALLWLPYEANGHPAAYVTWCRPDAIAAGCLLAFATRAPSGRRVLDRVGRSPLVATVLALLAVVIAGMTLPLHWAGNAWYFTAEAGGLTTLVWLAVAHPAGRIGQLLNGRVLVWLGALSYSLYVWQEPFSGPAGATTWAELPMYLTLAVVCAIASRYLVELPFLWLKDRGKKGKNRFTTK